MRKRFLVPLACLLVAAAVASDETPLTGFTPARARAQRALEQKFLAVPDPARAEVDHRTLTAEPHGARSAADPPARPAPSSPPAPGPRSRPSPAARPTAAPPSTYSKCSARRASRPRSKSSRGSCPGRGGGGSGGSGRRG